MATVRYYEPNSRFALIALRDSISEAADDCAEFIAARGSGTPQVEVAHVLVTAALDHINALLPSPVTPDDRAQMEDSLHGVALRDLASIRPDVHGAIHDGGELRWSTPAQP